MSRRRCSKVWVSLIYFMCSVRGWGGRTRLSCYLCYLCGDKLLVKHCISNLVCVDSVGFFREQLAASFYIYIYNMDKHFNQTIVKYIHGTYLLHCTVPTVEMF